MIIINFKKKGGEMYMKSLVKFSSLVFAFIFVIQFNNILISPRPEPPDFEINDASINPQPEPPGFNY